MRSNLKRQNPRRYMISKTCEGGCPDVGEGRFGGGVWWDSPYPKSRSAVANIGIILTSDRSKLTKPV